MPAEQGEATGAAPSVIERLSNVAPSLLHQWLGHQPEVDLFFSSGMCLSPGQTGLPPPEAEQCQPGSGHSPTGRLFTCARAPCCLASSDVPSQTLRDRYEIVPGATPSAPSVLRRKGIPSGPPPLGVVANTHEVAAMLKAAPSSRLRYPQLAPAARLMSARDAPRRRRRLHEAEL